MKIQKRSYLFAILIPFSLIIIWEVIVRANIVPESQSAAPTSIIARLIELISNGILIKNALISLRRLVCGVLIASIGGIGSGILLSIYRIPDRIISPTIIFFSGIPVVVWMPFWIMIFGTGEIFKIGLAAIATFFLVHIHTYHALRIMDKQYGELADIYEVNLLSRIKKIYLPYSLPSVLTGIRISLAIGWIVLFFVEYASSERGNEGLGWFIADARAMGRIEDEFAGLLILGFAAYCIDLLLGFFMRRAVAWKDTERGEKYTHASL